MRPVRSLLERRASLRREERRAKTAFWALARAETPYVAAKHHDAVFIVPTMSDPKLFANNERRPEFVCLERACKTLAELGRYHAGDTIVDVGAHIGTTTIPALKEHGFGRAVAVEPDPENVQLLQANVALNGLQERVAVISAAVSDRAGQQLFSRGRRDEGEYRWMKGRLTNEPSPAAVPVETLTLDDLAGLGTCNPETTALLWLDCSGREAAALQKASSFLERRVPIVFATARGRLTASSPLVAELRSFYDRIVDLRSSSLKEPLPDWRPRFRPVEDLVELPERREKKVTDVLVL